MKKGHIFEKEQEGVYREEREGVNYVVTISKTKRKILKFFKKEMQRCECLRQS